MTTAKLGLSCLTLWSSSVCVCVTVGCILGWTTGLVQCSEETCVCVCVCVCVCGNVNINVMIGWVEGL